MRRARGSPPDISATHFGLHFSHRRDGSWRILSPFVRFAEATVVLGSSAELANTLLPALPRYEMCNVGGKKRSLEDTYKYVVSAM